MGRLGVSGRAALRTLRVEARASAVGRKLPGGRSPPIVRNLIQSRRSSTMRERVAVGRGPALTGVTARGTVLSLFSALCVD